MSKTFELLVVTPDGSRIEVDASGVVLPGAGGGFGILATHAPMVSAIEPGEMVIRGADGKSTHYAIGEGFVEVGSNRCTVLIDFADEAASIDRDRAQGSEERARKRLEEKEADLDPVRAEASLARAAARLKVSNKLG